MINNDNQDSIETVTVKPKAMSSNENNSTMSTNVISTNSNGDDQSAQNSKNDFIEKETNNNQLEEVQQDEQEFEGEDDEFIRITAAHQMLTEAQTYDEQKNYPAALHLYRICVDLLLEELMFTEGTDQSRVYLREKCTAIMDRIDLLKTMLDPIPLPPTTTTTTTTATETTETTETTDAAAITKNEQTADPPTDELNSLHLS